MNTGKLSDLAATLPDKKPHKPRTTKPTPEAVINSLYDLSTEDLVKVRASVAQILNDRKAVISKQLEAIGG